MGNFGSKEDILVEIAVLFKQMDNGKLTLDELDDLVNMSHELHERTVILRYKAFEEKIFGVRTIVPEETENTEEEIVIAEVTVEPIIDPEPIIEEIEELVTEEIDEPLFQVEVKEEPSFGFSLFNDPLPIVEPKITEEKVDADLREEISIEENNEQGSFEEEIEEANSLFNSEIIEPTSVESNNEEFSSDRIMSETEQAHAENLAGFAKTTTETISPEASSETEPTLFRTDEPIFASSNEVVEDPFAEDFNEEIIVDAADESSEDVYEREVEEVESTLEIETEEDFDKAVMTVFINKYNTIGSNLASQFGVSKIESLIGSFGLNERLQFINELFDGSSESFSNAIKELDQQMGSEVAKSKVAEFAVENNWDVDSETVEEFMQKIVRRYA